MSLPTPPPGIQWPASRFVQVAVVVLAGLAGWLFYVGEVTQAGTIVAIVMGMLGFSREQQVAVGVGLMASRHASRAQEKADAAAANSVAAVAIVADTAARIDDKLTAVQAGVDNIINNPNMPGTPSDPREHRG